jgi:polyhydroxyalkanoate synthesis repressor PhaR
LPLPHKSLKSADLPGIFRASAHRSKIVQCILFGYDGDVPEERLIRKYANRRFYDATASRHVTLDDIRKMIGGGERVKVIDDRTGEDLTRPVLVQIIANQEQFGTPVLSTPLLEALVRFYGNPVQELLTRYLEQSIGGLLRQQQLMRAEMAKALESPMAPLADLARRNMELWAKMQASMLSAFQPPSAPAGEPPGASSASAAHASSASAAHASSPARASRAKPRAGRVQPTPARSRSRPRRR